MPLFRIASSNIHYPSTVSSRFGHALLTGRRHRGILPICILSQVQTSPECNAYLTHATLQENATSRQGRAWTILRPPSSNIPQRTSPTTATTAKAPRRNLRTRRSALMVFFYGFTVITSHVVCTCQYTRPDEVTTKLKLSSSRKLSGVDGELVLRHPIIGAKTPVTSDCDNFMLCSKESDKRGRV